MIRRPTDCVFCQPSDLTLWQGEELALLVDPAPIVEGHGLVYSMEHYPSAADVPPRVADELQSVCDWTRALYLAEYRAYAMFEHGRTGHCVRRSPHEQICHHAHIHVLPLEGDLAEAITLGQATTWRTWSEMAELASELDGYLVVESAAGRYFYPVTRPLAPHFLRTVAASLAGDVARADWERVILDGGAAEQVAQARRRLGARIAQVAPPPRTPQSRAVHADREAPASSRATSSHRSTISPPR